MTLLSKVWFDLWQDKSRTFQVVLVIALGAIGIGLVIGGRNLVADSVATGSLAAEPPHIKLSVSPPLTDEQLDRIARIEGVAEVEGLQNAPVEWRLAGTEEWQTGLLKAREDYLNQKMSLDGLVSGEWPGRNTLGIGQVSVGESGVFEGDIVELRFGDSERTLEVVATMDPIGPEPVFGETFYANSTPSPKSPASNPTIWCKPAMSNLTRPEPNLPIYSFKIISKKSTSILSAYPSLFKIAWSRLMFRQPKRS